MAARVEAALAGEPERAEALIAANRRAYADWIAICKPAR